MAIIEGFFETADGLRIHYRDHAPQGRGPSGPPVLCLHGLTRNLRDFDELAPMIAGLGRRVITASQRGRGLSSRDPVTARYHSVTYVGDMLALLDFLEVPAAVFIGTSMGGLMTIIAANQAPGRVAAAVLNDVGPELDPVGLARLGTYVGKGTAARSWPEAAAMCRAINQVAFPDESGEAFWMAFARKLFREEAPDRIVLDYDPSIAQAVEPGEKSHVDLWPIFDALLPVPLLLVRGEVSDLLMAATVAEMRLRKPDLVFVSVPRVGHAPFLTEAVAWAALERFLVSGAR